MAAAVKPTSASEFLEFEAAREGDMNFPHDVLAGNRTALVMFAAAFHGLNDAYWIKEAGMDATCVDIDREKLAAMKDIYPDSWMFVEADAYRFADSVDNYQWDVVTLYPFTNEFTACADNIRAWCKVARRAVVLGTGIETVVEAPQGWRIASVRKRSTYDGGVFWTVLERV